MQYFIFLPQLANRRLNVCIYICQALFACIFRHVMYILFFISLRRTAPKWFVHIRTTSINKYGSPFIVLLGYLSSPTARFVKREQIAPPPINQEQRAQSVIFGSTINACRATSLRCLHFLINCTFTRHNPLCFARTKLLLVLASQIALYVDDPRVVAHFQALWMHRTNNPFVRAADLAPRDANNLTHLLCALLHNLYTTSNFTPQLRTAECALVSHCCGKKKVPRNAYQRFSSHYSILYSLSLGVK